MMSDPIKLAGCAPIPLASYLKALGVFRAIAEQADMEIRAYWRDETFFIETKLSPDHVMQFFAHEYQPSAIISPWSGRAGFLEGEDQEESTRAGAELVRRLAATKATRFSQLKSVVLALLSNSILSELNLTRSQRKTLDAEKKRLKTLGGEKADRLIALKKRETELKGKLIGQLRGAVPNIALSWMDACWRIADSERAATSPLLGSGGNDGSRDFGLNFGECLTELFDLDSPTGTPKGKAEERLRSALFGLPVSGLDREAMGQFAPAQTGPNAGIGFASQTPLNPWDVVLSLEGTVLFAGATTRRLGATRSDLAFPFTVRTTGAGAAGLDFADEPESRGEIWAPLWQRPALFVEIGALMSEGRATLGRRAARDGVDFTRAAAALGVDRGISSFQRFSFLKREGRNFIGSPLSRIQVHRNVSSDLISDLDKRDWLRRFRQYARSKAAPARLQSAAMRLENAIFSITQQPAPSTAQLVLIAIGEAAAYLASSADARDPEKGKQSPPPRLSQKWFEAANDQTAEFRIAATLAALGQLATARVDAGVSGESNPDDQPDEKPVEPNEPTLPGKRHEFPPPFCAHLAPLDPDTWQKSRFAWGSGEGLKIWGAGPLERNLIGVIERRVMYFEQSGIKYSPFESRLPADLASVLAFLRRDTDDAKIAALVQGLAWANAPDKIWIKASPCAPMALPYALVKPLFTPTQQLRDAKILPKDAVWRFPRTLVSRLRAGDVRRAVNIATQKAKASGIRITFDADLQTGVTLSAARLLASLAIPIATSDLLRVLERAYPELIDSQKAAKEAANAA